MSGQGIDFKKIRKLYDEYGTLEKAVEIKRSELKKLGDRKTEAEHELIGINTQVSKSKNLLADLDARCNQCSSQLQAAESLSEKGFTLPVLEKLSALAAKLNIAGPEDLLDALQNYDSIAQLRSTVQNLASEKTNLTSNCNQLKNEQDRLQKSVDELTPMANSLSKDVKEKELSSKHLMEQIQGLSYKRELLYRDVKAKEAAKESLEASIRDMQKQLTDLESLKQQEATLRIDIQTMQSLYEENVRKLNKLSAQGEELGDILQVAKYLTIIEKNPEYAKNLPNEYLHSIISLLTHLSTAKGFNPQIQFKLHFHTFSESFLTILDQAGKNLEVRNNN